MSEVTAEDVARVASSFARQELEAGARLERERIIKLLESKITCDWKQEHCEACDQTDYLIALIKGEKSVHDS